MSSYIGAKMWSNALKYSKVVHSFGSLSESVGKRCLWLVGWLRMAVWLYLLQGLKKTVQIMKNGGLNFTFSPKIMKKWGFNIAEFYNFLKKGD